MQCKKPQIKQHFRIHSVLNPLIYETSYKFQKYSAAARLRLTLSKRKHNLKIIILIKWLHQQVENY